MKALPASRLGKRRHRLCRTRLRDPQQACPRFIAKPGRRIRHAKPAGVSVRRRQRRLGGRARFLCVACAPARQADLADYRRNLCADLQAAATAAHGHRDAAILRLVISRRRQIGGGAAVRAGAQGRRANDRVGVGASKGCPGSAGMGGAGDGQGLTLNGAPWGTSSNVQHDQFDKSDADQQHRKRHVIVFEPMPIIGKHHVDPSIRTPRSQTGLKDGLPETLGGR